MIVEIAEAISLYRSLDTLTSNMSQEPKKMDRRNFIYAGLGAAIVIVGGAAVYFATKPAETVTSISTSTTTATTATTVSTTVPTTTSVVSTTTVPTTSVVTTTSTLTPTEVTLRVFHTWVETRPIYKPYMNQVDQYNKMTPGVTVNSQFLDWTNFVPIVTAMIKAGVPPDSVTPADREISKLASVGYFLPLDDRIPKELMNEIPQSFWDATKYEGKIYGVPTSYSSIGGIYYNQEMFAKEGIEPSTLENPWSWDEFIEICKKLTKPDEGIYAYGARAAATGYFIPRHFSWFFFMEGVDTLVQTNGVWKSGASLPGFKRALEKIYDLVHTYKVMPKEVVGWQSADDQRAEFCAKKKVAMVHCEGWFRGQLTSFHPDFKWGFCYSPQLGNSMQKNSMMMECGTFAIFKESMHPDETMRWILYMSDYENVAGRFVPEGYIPPFSRWKDDPRCDDFQRKHVTAFPYCRPIFAPHPKAFDVNSKVFEPGIQELILGKITPDALAQKMDEQITKILGS